MKFGIVSFPGSNGDYDAFRAAADQLGEEAVYLWHKDHDLQGADVIILPGGFSYGDYLRAGAIARFSPIMQEVAEHAKRGGPVLAICNGFQVACEAGLLPGALMRNASLKFVSQMVHIQIENAETLFTSGYTQGQIIQIPIAHGEGRYTALPETIQELENNRQVVFRYCNSDGVIGSETNPNGSTNDIAGIVSQAGNVLGMMPHPERAVEALVGSADGLGIFTSLLARVGV
jgi:phosphoribosylformylglycinamidine synthase subunit PurQ / glutaminase